MPVVYKLFRPGDVVTDIREVGPGANTEFLRLNAGQVVNNFGGQEAVKDRNGNLIYPSPHCQHCGMPAYARDSLGRKYLWDDGDARGCHCPANPIGDGSDGGPILPRTPEDRRVAAAEQLVVETRRHNQLLEAILKNMGADLPVAEKTQVAPVAATKVAPEAARKAS